MPTKSITISYDYRVGRNAIPVSDCHIDLGVLLQSKLNWSNHYMYNLMCSKAYKVLNLVRRSFSSSNFVVTIDEVSTSPLLGLKYPIAVNFGALYLSRTSRNSKVYNVDVMT